MIFEVMWGGYYTSLQDDETWSIFRLLDFNREALHATLYRQRFNSQPVMEHVALLDTAVAHAPIAPGQVVHFPATLIGAQPLTLEDLAGYDTYLQAALELEVGERTTLLDKLIGFSAQPPLSFRMEIDSAGDLLFEQ